VTDRHARDGKILDRPLGVDAPIGGQGNFDLAEEIMLDADRRRGRRMCGRRIQTVLEGHGVLPSVHCGFVVLRSIALAR
jgi:hypothetical protein